MSIAHASCLIVAAAASLSALIGCGPTVDHPFNPQDFDDDHPRAISIVHSDSPTEALAVREGEVFFTTQLADRLERCELPGEREVLLESGGSALLLDAETDSLVLLDDDWQVTRVPLDGTAAEPIAWVEEIGQTYFFERADRTLYAAGQVGAFRLDLDDEAPPEKLVDLDGELQAFAVSGEDLYFVVAAWQENGVQGSPALRRWSKGVPKTQLIALLEDDPMYMGTITRRIAVAGEWIYVADGADGGTVHRMAKAGGELETVMVAGHSVNGMLIDDGWLYVTTPADVSRTRLDGSAGAVETLASGMGWPLQMAIQDRDLFVTSHAAGNGSLLVIPIPE